MATMRIAGEGEYIKVTMGNIQELEKQLAEAKAEEKRKELQTLTENLISKYQGSLRSHSFERKTDQRTLQLCFMKRLQAIR
jgi:hypothetical protein